MRGESVIGCERHGALRADGNQSGFVGEQCKITGKHRCDGLCGEDAPPRQIRHGPIQQHAAASGVGWDQSATMTSYLAPCGHVCTVDSWDPGPRRMTSM